MPSHPCLCPPANPSRPGSLLARLRSSRSALAPQHKPLLLLFLRSFASRGFSPGHVQHGPFRPRSLRLWTARDSLHCLAAPRRRPWPCHSTHASPRRSPSCLVLPGRAATTLASSSQPSSAPGLCSLGLLGTRPALPSHVATPPPRSVRVTTSAPALLGQFSSSHVWSRCLRCFCSSLFESASVCAARVKPM